MPTLHADRMTPSHGSDTGINTVQNQHIIARHFGYTAAAASLEGVNISTKLGATFEKEYKEKTKKLLGFSQLATCCVMFASFHKTSQKHGTVSDSTGELTAVYHHDTHLCLHPFPALICYLTV